VYWRALLVEEAPRASPEPAKPGRRSARGGQANTGIIYRKNCGDCACRFFNRLLDGFEGKLTSSKWAKIEKCSADTALRDINELVAHGILARDEAGGRSTSYSLAEIKADR
jgi:Fic family protein